MHAELASPNRFFALLITSVIVTACSTTARPPIIVVIADTVRADHLGVYGYERPTSPHLDKLATEGMVFEHAFSAASWTLPSVTTILTGRWPSQHGAGAFRADERRRFTKLQPSSQTIAEALAERGYSTGAVVNAEFLHPRFGLDRGFTTYDWARVRDTEQGREERRADEVVTRALDWIDGQSDLPFFLLVHWFDAHRHFDAPEPIRGKFTEAFREAYGDTLDTLESRSLAEQRGDLEFHIAAYDEELAFVDSQMARLVQGLRDRGLWNRSLVILTSDHGESLHDHGEKGHGGTLYNELIHVPLLMWGPGVADGRYEGAVSLVDLAPTILEAAGAEVPPGLPGIPLWPFLAERAAPADRTIIAEMDPVGWEAKAVIRWPYKLIFDPAGGGDLLFDLSTDFGETNNLATAGSRATTRIVRALRLWALAEEAGVRGPEVQLDPKALEDLRALGYIR